MKHIKHTLLFLSLFTFVITAYAESPKREFRATWLATVWAIDWPDTYATSTANIATQKSELTAILDQLVAANMNAVCFQIRGLGDVMYKSSLEPWSSSLTGTRGKDPGYDPLAFAIEEAHKRGLELHAWMNPFRYESTSGSHGTSDPVRRDHPDWLITYNNGSFAGTLFDPGLPAVRDYVVQVVQEVVETYDVDGVLFDDYFYPYGGTTTEDKVSMAAYKPSSQSASDWRRENIDKTMKGVYDMIQSKKPWVRFGIAPFGIWSTQSAAASKYGVTLPSGITGTDAYEVLACNTLSWMQGGYVDYISPQLYWATTSSGQSYITLSKWWSDMAKHFSDLLAGKQKVHFFSSQTSSSISSTAEHGLQIDNNRKNDQLGGTGSIFYNTNTFISKGFPSYLSGNKFTQEALPPAMDWKSATTLVAPSNVSLSGTTLSWSHATAERFTVYAYTKGTDVETALASSSNLVKVVYGKSLDVSDVSGYANKTFAVCAYDRYGNEYTPGLYNAAASDPVITPAVSSVTNTMKVNATISAYTDVVVSGQYLTADMTISTDNNNYITVTKQSDWNSLTGGTLRIATKTGLSAGTYTNTITIQSGNAKATISVKSVINALTPIITLSSATASLSYKVNATSLSYKDVTVQAEDLTADLAVSCSNDFVTATTQSGWNVRTGGTLRIAPKAGLTAGTYTSVVTVKSGTALKTIAVTVVVKALEPTIGASVSTVAIVGKFNVTPAPYQDIKITAQDLSADMTVSCTNSVVTVVEQSDWNARTGGTLRITIDTSKETGTYTGEITISNGTVSKVVSVKATINNLEPIVSALVKSVNMAGAKGDEIYRDVVISAANLSEDLIVSCTNSVVTVAQQSDWNVRTGGTLRLTLNTSKTVGDYSGLLTVTSGASKVEITVAATIDAVIDEEENEDPYVRATPRIVEFAVKEGAANPSQSIVVSTGNVSRRYSLNVASISSDIASVISYNTSNWSYRGGTLNLTADASAAPGTYTGTITLSVKRNSGNRTYTTVIDVTLVIVESNPIITASASSISLAAEQSATAPYEDVFVTASDVVGALNISAGSLPVTITKASDWNDLTGGTFRVTLNTNAAANTYSDNITISSGSTEVLIPVAATITAIPPKEGTITFNTTAIWTKTTADVTYLSTSANNRSMAYYNGRLYISDRTAGGYHVVDPANGNLIGTVLTGETGFYAHNLRITNDGQMLLGNTGSASASSLVVKSWNMNTETLTSLSSDKLTGRCDFFYPYGNWNSAGYVLALTNDGNRLMHIPFSNGVLGTASILTNSSLPTGKSVKAIPAGEDVFYASAHSTIPTKHSLADGSLLESFGTVQPVANAGASGIAHFTIHGNSYLITPTDALGGFDIFDITSGLNNATRVITPVVQLGTTENTAYTIDFCTHIDGNDVYIYQLVPCNGLRAYKFTFTPESVETKLETIESNVRIFSTLNGVEVLFDGTEMVSIYSINGTLISQGVATEHYACDLQSGLYIVRVGEMVRKVVK